MISIRQLTDEEGGDVSASELSNDVGQDFSVARKIEKSAVVFSRCAETTNRRGKPRKSVKLD